MLHARDARWIATPPTEVAVCAAERPGNFLILKRSPDTYDTIVWYIYAKKVLPADMHITRARCSALITILGQNARRKIVRRTMLDENLRLYTTDVRRRDVETFVKFFFMTTTTTTTTDLKTFYRGGGSRM